MKIIDITGMLEKNIWNYPDDERYKFSMGKITDIDKGEDDTYFYSMSCVTGTYLETAAHRIKGVWTIDQVPLERLINIKSVIANIPKGPKEHIEIKEIEPFLKLLNAGDALIVNTGWSKNWYSENFVYLSPHFSSEAMDAIIERKPFILAADVPCYDDPAAGEAEGLLNRYFKQTGGLILAPVANLERITKKCADLTVLPMKIKGACGCQCRAVVIEA